MCVVPGKYENDKIETKIDNNNIKIINLHKNRRYRDVE